ncbi:MAG TPA: DUF4838 domain-containing protein [Candidatus Brocadiia bacterium]|nr:DUF4838 domain-containing protein [Candidatus Brocadiia bacterium]
MRNRTTAVATLTWVIATLVAVAALAQEPVRLAQDGKPVAVIVLGGDAATQRANAAAAALLSAHLQQMTGAAFPIKPESELGAQVRGGLVTSGAGDLPAGAKNFVIVGHGALAKALGVTAEGVGVGGMRLKTTANAVVLLGGPAEEPGHTDPYGARYAAIELLERLGVRYLWPGEEGRVVPKLATVDAPALDIACTPQVKARGMRWARLGDRGQMGLDRLNMSQKDWQRAYDAAEQSAAGVSWSEWQRLGGSMPSFGHAGGGLRDAARYLKERPEWFALQADGTRDQGGDPRFRLCKSNPDLIEHVAQDIIERVKADASITLVSLDSNDGGGNTGWCLCDKCRALDAPNGPKITMTTFGARVSPDKPARKREQIECVSLTDRLVFYWNSIAERVVKVHPNLLFGVSAYSVFSNPPVQRKLHPNLVLRYVPSDMKRWQGWQAAGARRIYWRPNILLMNRRHGKLCSIVGQLAENMSAFAKAGMFQTDFDSIFHNWSTMGLSYYAAARLNWRPDLTAGEIIADYARAGFGAGAQSVQRYFERVEAITRGGGADEEEITGAAVKASHETAADYCYTPAVAKELHGLLNDAAAAAKDDAGVQKRIAFLRLGLLFTELQETLDDMARRAKAGEKVDMNQAKRLVDLNCLALRDLTLNHTFAINVPQLIWGTGTFARWAPLGGRRVAPSDPKLLDRLKNPRFRLTGREQGIADMLKAYGMDK